MHPLLQTLAPLFVAFERAGRDLFLVGGTVRDQIMGRALSTDIDFATDAPPEETEKILKLAHFRAFPIGARFGTIATRYDSLQIEITTYRVAERYQPGSRHPEVTFGTSLEADLARRDLSINAMAMDRSGFVRDPWDGQTAILRRTLEVPGGGLDNTVSILRDDPLRILRIARFASTLGFVPTRDTTTAARQTAQSLHDISHERWKMELDKLLPAPHAADGLRWLVEIGALQVIFPEADEVPEALLFDLARLVGAAALHLGVRRAVLVLGLAWGSAIGALPDLGAPSDRRPDVESLRRHAGEVARRFRFSNDERVELEALCTTRLSAQAMGESWDDRRLRRWLSARNAIAEAEIDLVLGLTPLVADRPSGARILGERIAALRERENPVPSFPTGLGRRISERFRVAPGRALGRAMALLREAVLDGEVPNEAPESVYLDFLEGTRARWLDAES